MSLTIEDLFQKIILPKKYFSNDFNISDKFREESTIFLTYLDQCTGEEFNPEKQPLIKEQLESLRSDAKGNVKSILDIFDYFENADLKNAQNKFDELLQRIENDIFISTIDDYVFINVKDNTYSTSLRVTRGSQYYRVRAVDYESDSIAQNPEELFHISYSKRAIANAGRFSLAGFPSLYLSTMLPLAWQECGYPSKYYYSEYQYERNYELFWNESSLDRGKELNLLSLYSPTEIRRWGTSVKFNHFDLWVNVVFRYLRVYPLILACSFVNQSGHAPFKQEYIIPQMLMQWVQRNYSKVQGISYFTCIDTSMWNSQWCAYNIVIPALKPYDLNGYSEFLKEKFCWTKSQFFLTPIANTNSNRIDREFLYSLASDINLKARIYAFSSEVYQLLSKMLNICGCLMSVLDKGKTLDMELALHILNSISQNCTQLQRVSLKNLLRDSRFDSQIQNYEEAYVALDELLSKFLNRTSSKPTVIKIIEKYQWNCWNDSPSCPRVVVCFSRYDQIIEPLKWLHENHILHYGRKLTPDDQSIQFLKKLANEDRQTMQEFWDIPIGDDCDEWMKNSIQLIKGPILVKQHNGSEELLQIGFDPDALVKCL
nr:hypothetical protein [uncultured Agathobaculum sp.]